MAQPIESTRSTSAIFKRLFYLTMQHPEKFLPEVTEAVEALEAKPVDQLPAIEKTANILYKARDTELARNYLTYFSNTETLNALSLAEALSASIEARTRLLYGFIEHAKAGSPDVIW